MRTAHRIPAPAGLVGAAQNAPAGDAGLWISADRAFGPAVACSLHLAAALVPTRRLAPVEGQSAPLSPALGSQSALASPSSTRGGLAPLSSALSHHLARLFLTLVDHPLAPVWIFVLKLCSGSCTMYPYVRIFKEFGEGDRLDRYKNPARLCQAQQAQPDAQMSYLENHLQPVDQDGYSYRTFWDW